MVGLLVTARTQLVQFAIVECVRHHPQGDTFD
jgi:hypothetical protein